MSPNLIVIGQMGQIIYNESVSGIFKAYDIRGIYPHELNEKVAEKVSLAFIEHLRRNNLLSSATEFLIGRDGRISSPVLAKSVISAVTRAGFNVQDCGIVTTDAFYYAIGELGFDAGLMITASHNPSEYNGFKLVTRDVNFVSGEDLEQIVSSLPRVKPG